MVGFGVVLTHCWFTVVVRLGHKLSASCRCTVSVAYAGSVEFGVAPECVVLFGFGAMSEVAMLACCRAAPEVVIKADFVDVPRSVVILDVVKG